MTNVVPTYVQRYEAFECRKRIWDGRRSTFLWTGTKSDNWAGAKWKPNRWEYCFCNGINIQTPFVQFGLRDVHEERETDDKNDEWRRVIRIIFLNYEWWWSTRFNSHENFRGVENGWKIGRKRGGEERKERKEGRKNFLVVFVSLRRTVWGGKYFVIIIFPIQKIIFTNSVFAADELKFSILQ